MKWVDNLSKRIALYAVKTHNNHVRDNDSKIEGISQEIDILRELQCEILKRDKEIERQRLEWDRTFDSIIDNIVLIDNTRCISKINRSFVSCVREAVGPWDSLIGMPWQDFKEDMNMDETICYVEDCFKTKKSIEGVIKIGCSMYSIIVNPIFDDHDVLVGVVRISRDITKINYQKSKLERRSGINQAISKMSKILVNHDNWGEAVDTVLGDLGEAIGANRVYVFKNFNRGDMICSTLQHYFRSDIYRTYKECEDELMVECINYDLVPQWQNEMVHGNSVMGNITECKKCPQIQRCDGIADVIVSAVPIFVDGVWWGFIGFDYKNNIKRWKDDDEAMLRIAADILGGVIYHRCRYWDAVSNLESCEEKLEV